MDHRKTLPLSVVQHKVALGRREISVSRVLHNWQEQNGKHALTTGRLSLEISFSSGIGV